MKIMIFFGLFLAVTTSADVLKCNQGTNIWGENIRTGKAFGHSMGIAQQTAYIGFLNNLTSLGKECIENESGRLEFDTIQSLSGQQKSEEYWATFAVNVACCK